MDEQKLKARIGELRDQLEKLGARARVPSRSAGKSAGGSGDVPAALEQLRAKCDELLDTGQDDYRPVETHPRRRGELAGVLLDSLPHVAVVVDRDNTVLAANRIARRMGVKTGGLCWEEIPRSLCASGQEDAASDPSDELPSGGRCSFCRCEEAIAKQYALRHPGIEAFGKSWDAYWIPLDEDTCLHYMADVTEVKRREEELRESESRSRSLYEAVHAGIVLQAADGTILHANRVACEIFGMEEEDITARTSLDPGWEMIMEDGSPVPGEEHPSMITIRTGKPIRNAVRGLFAGEEARTRWLLINTEPILDPVTEKLKEVLVTFSDITERKRAERAIEDLAKFPSENPHPVMRVQADGTVLYMNAASESVLADRGCRVGETVPEEWAKLVADVLESGSVESADLEHDGSIFSFRVVPVTDAGYVNWYGRDVTDFRRAAEQVERLAKFPSENPHPVLRVERDGALLYANAACESLLREWGCSIGKQVPDEWREWVGGVLDSGSGRTVAVEHGDRILSFELAPVVEAGYANIYGRDVTERKRAEEELRQIEWLLTRSAPVRPGGGHEYEPAYGDLTHLNTHRLILDSVGGEMLEDIACDYLDLLQSSSAVYEKNGDYALGIFASGWCQFMDDASRRECGTLSNAEALKCGRWHCHESCWTEASKVAIEEARPVDIECNGGIRLYAVPIRAGEEVIGAIDFGYGDPPQDPEKLSEIAERYGVTVEELATRAARHESRPRYMIEVAKTRLETSARLIGEIVERKRAEEEVRKARDELERRVQVRTADLAGALDGLQGEVRERIEVQKALAEANELLERMFSSIELMVAYMDRDFNFIRVNRAYAEADNHPPEFFVGKNHFDLYPSEENEAIFRRTLETGQPFFAYEKPFASAQNPERGGTYWDWSLQPVLEADGEVGGLILCLFNVTERIRAREEAENQRRRLFGVLNMLPGYVFLMGPDYSIRFANHTFTDLFGDVGKDACHKVVHGIDRPCPLCPAARVLATQQPTTWEWTSDCGRCYRVYAYPFSDVDGSQLVLKLGIDITDRKVLENEVLEMSVKERRRIGQDLHDSLGQTLTGVAFLSKVLQEKLGKKSMPEASDAAEIAKQINASISLTRSLARGLSPVTLEAGGLMDALREYAADIQELYRISCVFQCDESVLVSDNVVAIHVYHIAQEAVSNAIRHGEARNISVRLDADDNTVNLTISDDGKGLPDGIDAAEGMGLRIMDYRARAIGGALEVTRGPERGTVVRCSFKNPSRTS